MDWQTWKTKWYILDTLQKFEKNVKKESKITKEITDYAKKEIKESEEY